MKGYEGCYDGERETQEEGAGEHSEKITDGEEQGRGVEGVSRARLGVGGDGTARQIETTKKRGRTDCYRDKKKPAAQLRQK